MARAVTDAGKAGLAEICGPPLPSLLRRHHRYPCDAGSAPFPVMREAEEGDDEVGGSGMTEGSREGEGVAEQPYDENWTVLIYCRRGAMRDGPYLGL